MTSRFHAIGHKARGVGSIDVGAALQQLATFFQRIRQGSPRFLPFTTAASYTPGAKSAIYDRFFCWCIC